MRLLLKLTSWAIFIGFLGTAILIWDIFDERGMNSTAVAQTVDQVNLAGERYLYVQVQGGLADFSNIYEYSIGSRNSETKLSKEYYVPVLDTTSGEVKYVAKMRMEPDERLLLDEINLKGKLSASDVMPSDLISAYASEYPDQNYFLLDVTYVPQTLWQKLKNVRPFIIVFILGIVIRMGLNRLVRPKQDAIETEQEAPQAE